MITNELLREAEGRFPAGTVFTNTNVIPSCDSVITSVGNVRKSSGDTIVVNAKNGGTYTVYKDGKWAIRKNPMPVKPYYVRIIASGPNNSLHPKYGMDKVAIKGTGPQTFKIIEEDESNRTQNEKDHTLITEDGYCLWTHCVKIIPFQEYEAERSPLEPKILIFN